MAKETLELTNTIKVLNEYATAWANAYRAELIAEGKRATGDLIRSIKGEVVITNDEVSAVLNVEDYWKNVEYGRRSKQQDSSIKFPPISAILKWIQVKPVIPRPDTLSGKVPTQAQLAFLIARSIQQNGIPPTHALRDTNEATFNAFEQKLRDALTADLEHTAFRIVKAVIEPKQ